MGNLWWSVKDLLHIRIYVHARTHNSVDRCSLKKKEIGGQHFVLGLQFFLEKQCYRVTVEEKRVLLEACQYHRCEFQVHMLWCSRPQTARDDLPVALK